MNPIIEAALANSLVNEHGVKEVAAGAKLLDETLPGWAKSIDLDYFRISSGYSCVLGQIYGEYIEGWYRLKQEAGLPEDEEGETYGFDSSSSNDIAYRDLQEAWVLEIMCR